MWSNYLITAWRSLKRNRLLAFVHIVGMALAISACLLIGLYMLYEWRYDRQSPHAAHIWRAYNETVADGRIVTQDANTHGILGPSLKADLPEVVAYTRLYNHGQQQLNVLVGSTPATIQRPWMVDTGFLQLFPQRFLFGQPEISLQEPYSVVLTQSAAQNLFGAGNPVGAHLKVPGGWFAGDYTVTGVVADPPVNTHVKFGMLVSYTTRHAQGHRDSWDDYWDYTYFQLAAQADVQKVKHQLALYSDQHLKREGIRLNMQPFTGIHLHSNLTYEIEPNGNAGTLKALGWIALFILVIAFVNYINLSTAQSLLRAKEVGVRKVLGAKRQQLVWQFLFEGGLSSLIAIGLAVLLLLAAQPSIEQFLGKPLMNYPGFTNSFWWLIPAIWIASLAAACLYPALVLSSFSPLAILRGRFQAPGRSGLRQALVVFQFACSTILIAGVLVITQQLRFLREHDKGLSLSQVVAFKTPDVDWSQDSLNHQRMARLRQGMAAISGVRSVATSSIVPGEGIATISGTSGGLFWTQRPSVVAPATVYFFDAEPSFFTTYSIRFIAGEPFAATNRRAAREHIVINETARRLFGFASPSAAIGQELAYQVNPGIKMRIHGVVNDFHIESSKEPVRPTLYYCSPPLSNGYLSARVEVASLGATLQQMQKTWKEVFPESSFEALFLDERFKQQYDAEQQLAYLVSGFTLFAIFIACMGLFGLATFSAGRRIREIGIRKVLGASVLNIASMLSADFLKPVCIAVLLALPIAAWLMHHWLQDFAYRISLRWWLFLLAAFVAFIIAVLTVAFQSMRAASASPVKNLRTE